MLAGSVESSGPEGCRMFIPSNMVSCITQLDSYPLVMTVTWLVVDQPLWKNMSSSVSVTIPNIWKNQKYSKPPTSYRLLLNMASYFVDSSIKIVIFHSFLYVYQRVGWFITRITVGFIADIFSFRWAYELTLNLWGSLYVGLNMSSPFFFLLMTVSSCVGNLSTS